MPGRGAWGAMRSADARLTLAALKAAITSRAPPPGCIHHADRGSQSAAEDYRAELAAHGLRGSMGRRGSPCDNAKAESFMKTLKVEEVYLMEYETFEVSPPRCRASSRTSTMPSVATPHSATRALSTSNRSTPARWSIDGHHVSTPRGAVQ